MIENETRNVWAIGRNFGEHAKELGNAKPTSGSEPIIFLKAGTSIVTSNGMQSPFKEFFLPKFSNEVHHEVEVAFQFGADLKFDHLTIAVDLTARDVQNRLKSQGHPWTLAKSFRDSCLIGQLVPLKSSLEIQNLGFTLHVNEELRQSGNTREMIHDIESIRRFLIQRFPIVKGDLVLTGTPSGVGQVQSNDVLVAEIPGITGAAWRAASPIN